MSLKPWLWEIDLKARAGWSGSEDVSKKGGETPSSSPLTPHISSVQALDLQASTAQAEHGTDALEVAWESNPCSLSTFTSGKPNEV